MKLRTFGLGPTWAQMTYAWSYLFSAKMDDEHRLIARYAAKLAAFGPAATLRTPSSGNNGFRQRELISHLEQRFAMFFFHTLLFTCLIGIFFT